MLPNEFCGVFRNDFNEIIRLNPANAKAYYGRGLVHAAQDNLDAAIAEFEQGLAVDTNPVTRQRAQEYLEDLKSQRAAGSEGK